ncbi:hypothetical protein Pyn_11098 [Prunus yedoensis var. nudiflora]|uniref:Uncharacterized protein n=1 Tax=Prunus yedoensis var. nudiflora TaxID=2094558 RepID=A0A314Z9S2_PRUYE|nr:hypothetical protein Pyn_11098 [Prunus yedoensis var. nudiflora]
MKANQGLIYPSKPFTTHDPWGGSKDLGCLRACSYSLACAAECLRQLQLKVWDIEDLLAAVYLTKYYSKSCESPQCSICYNCFSVMLEPVQKVQEMSFLLTESPRLVPAS